MLNNKKKGQTPIKFILGYFSNNRYYCSSSFNHSNSSYSVIFTTEDELYSMMNCNFSFFKPWTWNKEPLFKKVDKNTYFTHLYRNIKNKLIKKGYIDIKTKYCCNDYGILFSFSKLPEKQIKIQNNLNIF